MVQLQGVGFKTFTHEGRSTYQVGYSHYLTARLPVGVTLRSRRQQVVLSGGLAGLVAHRLCGLKLPDPYKGRGVYPTNVPPALKQGKRR